jgi:hypothetical protein
VVLKNDTPRSPPVKRARKIAYPWPDTAAQMRSQAKPTTGTSKQAVYKHKALEEIRNGTYICDHKRWTTFKGKIILMDPDAEVPDNPAHLLSVKHSRCSSWIRMSMPYNTERFKRHLKICTFSTAAGGMKTLKSYGIQVLAMNTPSQSSAPSLPNCMKIAFPCPGLTKNDDPHIGQYVK